MTWLPSLNTPLKRRVKLYLAKWKLMAHLTLRTKRFGVNNEWWSSFDSLWGWGLSKRLWAILTIRPMVDNMKMIWFRATACHFITDETYSEMYGRRKTK